MTITPAVLMTILIIIAGTYWASRLLQRMQRRNVFGRLGLREGTQATICRVFHYVIMCVGAYIAVNQAGINLTGVAAMTAVLMVGISLGLQNITVISSAGSYCCLSVPCRSEILWKSAESKVRFE